MLSLRLEHQRFYLGRSQLRAISITAFVLCLDPSPISGPAHPITARRRNLTRAGLLFRDHRTVHVISLLCRVSPAWLLGVIAANLRSMLSWRPPRFSAREVSQERRP